MKIGIIAGETSGDILGAGLIAALLKHDPSFTFVGIGGKRMQAVGCKSIAPIEQLNVMGLFEPLLKLPSLIRLKNKLINCFIFSKIDLFIGIDSPEFNLRIAHKLKKKSIQTLQYVSPQVWAWRPKRVKKIANSIDGIMTLFPFESVFYKQHQIQHAFVGHPLADKIPFNLSIDSAVTKLELNLETPVITVLPGARKSVLHYLAPVFLQAMYLLEPQIKVQWVVALTNTKRRDEFLALKNIYAPGLTIKCIVNQTDDALQAAQLVLTTSGTSTLETALYKKPMVVAYKMSSLTYFIAKRIVKLDNISLPNILAQEKVVPEYIQQQANPEQLADEIKLLFNSPERQAYIKKVFDKIHHTLRLDANKQAADFVLKFLT